MKEVKFAGWAGIALQGLLFAGAYFSTFKWLIAHDWSRDDYTYCYLVPVIVIYLIWEKRRELNELPSMPSWQGMLVFLPGIALFWLGELAGEYFTLYVSFWLVLLGLVWIYLGRHKLKVILFPLVFILTMFPLPNFLYNKVSVSLKLFSSQLGVAVMKFCGMSVYREGNVIDLGFTQLQVVDACSGLRYLIPLIVLGILLAYFFQAAFWKKIILVVSTVPVSIMVNGLRIASVGILYQFWGPMVAEGFFHDFSGWFIFMCSLGILVFEMWLLQKIPGKGRGQKGEVKGEDAVISRPPSAARPVSFSLFIVPSVLLCITLVLSQGIEFREKIPIKRSFDQFPLKVGDWTGTRRQMEQKYIDTLDLSDYLIIDYRNSKGRVINFYVAYYESQRKGESIHSPATCLSGGGWLFRQAGAVIVPGLGPAGGSMLVNRAFMQKMDYKQLSYYWFLQRGRVLTNAYQMKFFTFWDALTRQRTDGALVRVITPVHEAEGPKAAEARIQDFIRQIVPILAQFIPE